MARRWRILLATLAVAVVAALAATSASAATASSGSFRPGGPAYLVASEPGGLAAGISHEAQSSNWSGYAATSGTYTSVSASWTVPAGTCTSGDQYSSVWVGLDGYNSNSVEQTGSETDCSGTAPKYYAWYEMYPNASVAYSSTVKPGDHLSASVTYSSSMFSLHLADATRGWTHTSTATLAGAARSSAEVIVEAPCCTSSGAILPLADFGTVSITGAQANDAAFGNAGGMTEIAMIDNSGLDKVSVSPLSSSGEDFTTTWLRSS